MEENLPVVRLWLACQTQWRTGFAGATGLDYTAMFQVAGALGMQVDANTLGKVQHLENMTLERLHKEQAKKDRTGRQEMSHGRKSRNQNYHKR